MMLLSLKHAELEEHMRKWKARVVAIGCGMRDMYGQKTTEETLYQGTSDLPGLRMVAAHSLIVNDGVLGKSDGRRAYTQAPLLGARRRFLKLPKRFWPQAWIDRKMRQPLVEAHRLTTEWAEQGLMMGSFWRRY